LTTMYTHNKIYQSCTMVSIHENSYNMITIRLFIMYT